MSDQAADGHSIETPITVVGQRSLRLDPATVEAFEFVTRTVEVVCATGHRYTAEWTGISIGDLCEAVAASPETTHVVVESLDGYRIAIPILDGMDGVVALWKDGRPVGETNPYPNRFVAPDIDGARDVKGVARVEFHAVAADEDPDDLEQVDPDDDRFESDRD